MLVLSIEGGKDPAAVEAVYAPLGEAWSGHPSVGQYPLSSEYLKLPHDGRSVVPRIGLGVMGEFTYGPEGFDGFEPRLFAAMDLPLLAASSRDEPVVARLNWADQSIGVSDQLQFIERFDEQGVLSRVRLAGWYEHEGQWQSLGEDSPVSALGLNGQQLIDYLVFTVNTQVAGEGWFSPGMVMASSDRPSHGLVCVGTLPMSGQGKSPVVVEPGGVVHAVAYDPAVVDPDQVLATLQEDTLTRDGVSILSRRVVAVA